MIDPLFSEAWAHAPNGHKILGRFLHTFSALDLLTLEAINSPFLLDGAEAGLADLFLAVWILSNRHSLDCTLSHLEPTDEFNQWVKSVKDSVDMVRDCDLMATYIKDYYSLPEMMRTVADRPMTPLGSPWMLSTVVIVCRMLHVPLFEAWNMGIGQLMWYRSCIEEMDSDESRVVGPKLREDLERAKLSVTTWKKEEGETMEAFSQRSGISVEEARMFLGGD